MCLEKLQKIARNSTATYRRIKPRLPEAGPLMVTLAPLAYA